ncbi:MAG TPA: nucleotidyltransferase family protein [Candidatus Aphodomonas merdavium]|nr:nucleotidyltransferase family protein [Candidatus Aphodomonas merdavium]
MNKARVGCVLMASGYGKRFGGNKLLECVDGVPMVVRAMRAMPEGLFAARTLVTVYPQVAELAAREGFAPVANPDTQDDPAVTIRLGLAAMPDGLDGCLFSVCDQPWLTAQSVARLVDAFRREGGPVVLGFAGRRGNPVVFPKSLFPFLAALKPFETGRDALNASGVSVRLVQADSACELFDVDRREDLRHGLDRDGCV